MTTRFSMQEHKNTLEGQLAYYGFKELLTLSIHPYTDRWIETKQEQPWEGQTKRRARKLPLVIRLLKRPFAWQKKSRVDLGSQTAKKHGFVPIPKRHDMIDTSSLDGQNCEARTPSSTDPYPIFLSCTRPSKVHIE